MKLHGDFLYVIWFDVQADANWFEWLLKKHGFHVLRYHYRHTSDWAVIWHIGSEPKPRHTKWGWCPACRSLACVRFP